jgi:LPXTG-motif cell wall-anchored protein
MYAFVPDSWVASSRTLAFKFTGTGTGTGTTSQGYSASLTKVSGFTYLYTGTIPSVPTGWTDFFWTKVQLVSYASGASGENFTAATASSAVSGNEISVNYTKTLTRPTNDFASKNYDAAAESLNDWAARFLVALDNTNVCGATKAGAKDGSDSALKIAGAGWKIFGTEWSSLTNKANFTSAVASSTSALYYQRAASLYDYVLWKYGSVQSSGAVVLSNFAGRTVPSSAPTAAVVVSQNNDSSSTLVLAGLAAIAVLAAGSYFFIRKKKAD